MKKRVLQFEDYPPKTYTTIKQPFELEYNTNLLLYT